MEFERNKLEDKDKNNKHDFLDDAISVSKKSEIIDQINEMISKGDYYAKGYEGIIYKIKIDENTFVVSKIRKDQNKDVLKREMNYQIESYNICSTLSGVRSPKTYGIIADEGSQYLLMEFIEGMTLFSIKINETLKALHTETGINNYKKTTNDKESLLEIKKLIKTINSDNSLKGKFGKYLTHIPKLQKGIRYEQSLAYIYDLLSKDYDLGIFGNDQIESYKNNLTIYIQELRKNGIFHNDLSHRNIILGTDNNLYAIDFGLTGEKEFGILKDSTCIKYFKQLGISE